MVSEVPIRFACDGCGKAYKVRASRAGRQGKCKDCGAVFTVPEVLDTPALEELEDDFIALLDDDTPPKSFLPKHEAVNKPKRSEKRRAGPSHAKKKRSVPSQSQAAKQKPKTRPPDRAGRPSNKPQETSASSGQLRSEPMSTDPPTVAMDGAFEVALSTPIQFSRKTSKLPSYRMPRIPLVAGFKKLFSLCIALSIPIVIVGLALVGVFFSAPLMLQLFGVILLLIGLVWMFLTIVEYLRVGFQELGWTMWLTFVPIIGFLVVLRYWADLGGPIIRNLLATLVAVFGMACITFGLMAADRSDPALMMQSGPTAGVVSPYDAFGPGSRGWGQTPTYGSDRGSNGNPHSPAVPPPPPVPLLTAQDLRVAAQGMPSGAEGWVTFESPAAEVHDDDVFDVMGYRLPLPPSFSVRQISRVDGGVDATLWGANNSGRPAVVHLSIRPLARREGGRPIALTWAEALAASGVIDLPKDLQHGLINRLPFIRTATDKVATGSGIGKVVYVGLPGADFPVRIVLWFETYPHQNALALACEALVRSFDFADPVMADPFDPQVDTVTSPLPDPLPAGTSPGRSPIAGGVCVPKDR